MQEKTSFQSLPTGKPHVSFSEVKLWKECSYRHHLTHVKKLDFSSPSPVLEFGTAVHSACEKYLLTRVMDTEICMKALEAAWKKHEGLKDFTQKTLDAAKSEASSILLEVPPFLDR